MWAGAAAGLDEEAWAHNKFKKENIARRSTMPIFAYRCRSCGEEFQTLVMSGETAVCRSCESANLEQQLSLIASPNKGGDASAGSDADFNSCSTGMCCGGGACGAFADA